MRKLMILVVLLGAIAFVAACSNDGHSSAPSTVGSKPKVTEHQLGDTIYYHRTNALTNVTSKVAIVFTGYEILDEKTAKDSSKDTNDYIKLYVKAENVGDNNSTENAIRSSSLQVFDVNGKEITKLWLNLNRLEGEFEPTELRPGGKNEGYIYVAIEEDSEPAEIIYYDAQMKSTANQFVFKL